MLIKKINRLVPDQDVPEIVDDNCNYMDMLKLAHGHDVFEMHIRDAVEEHNLPDFLYFLFLNCIVGYMGDCRFSGEKYMKEYIRVVEQLKKHTIDIETLSLLRETVAKLLEAEDAMMAEAAEEPLKDDGRRSQVRQICGGYWKEDGRGHIPYYIEGCTIEDAFGDFYSLAAEILSGNEVETSLKQRSLLCFPGEKYEVEYCFPTVQYGKGAEADAFQKIRAKRISRTVTCPVSFPPGLRERIGYLYNIIHDIVNDIEN